VNKQHSHNKLDSIASLETLPLWPVEAPEKFKSIIKLAKNDQSGDLYAYVRKLDTDYVVNLNKIISLNDIYTLERTIIRANLDIKEAEEWATHVAAIVQYFHDDFIKGKLIRDIYYYIPALMIEKDLQEIQKKYKNNIDLYIQDTLLESDKNARNFYYRWRYVRQLVKSSPERDALYFQLKMRFH
jgi:hypothetical protein